MDPTDPSSWRGWSVGFAQEESVKGDPMPVGALLSMCAGVWVGNLLIHGIGKGKWNDGFWIGLIAACIVLVFGGLFL